MSKVNCERAMRFVDGAHGSALCLAVIVGHKAAMSEVRIECNHVFEANIVPRSVR